VTQVRENAATQSHTRALSRNDPATRLADMQADTHGLVSGETAEPDGVAISCGSDHYA
jgi:hypothetical protein